MHTGFHTPHDQYNFALANSHTVAFIIDRSHEVIRHSTWRSHAGVVPLVFVYMHSLRINTSTLCLAFKQYSC